MIDDADNFKTVVLTVAGLLTAEGNNTLSKLIKENRTEIECAGYNQWNERSFIIYVNVGADIYHSLTTTQGVESSETFLLEKFTVAAKRFPDQEVQRVCIVPSVQNKIDWKKIAGLTTQDDLIESINQLKGTMISVATGGTLIQNVNDTYRRTLSNTIQALQSLGLKNPNPYIDLWNWYEKWKRDFPTYVERRSYVTNLYESTLQQLQGTKSPELVDVIIDLQGWDKVRRNISEIETRAVNLDTEEQCQSMGHLCRESIISLAQAVYDPNKYPILDGVTASKTDSKRMLEAYIAGQMSGSTNEGMRKYTRSIIDLANELTHKRTATKKEALICKSATLTLINLVGLTEGKF